MLNKKRFKLQEKGTYLNVWPEIVTVTWTAASIAGFT